MPKKVIVLILLLFSSPAFGIPIESCRSQNKKYQSDLDSGLAELERIFIQYRWTEAKIRNLFYEGIWEARIQGNDPLSREKRDHGQDQEKRYLELLKPLRSESENLSTAFVRQVEKLKQTDKNVTSLCERRDVQACLILVYDPFYKILEQAKVRFGVIFEHEREYRTAVEKSSGGRDGLYPDDALEPPGEHTDYYWRFEQSKGPQRFEEDQEILRLVLAARKLIHFGDTGEGCCRQCI